MKTYLVGGAVRDPLLGLQPGDNDHVVVGSTPEQMSDMIRQSVETWGPVVEAAKISVD